MEITHLPWRVAEHEVSVFFFTLLWPVQRDGVDVLGHCFAVRRRREGEKRWVNLKDTQTTTTTTTTTFSSDCVGG